MSPRPVVALSLLLALSGGVLPAQTAAPGARAELDALRVALDRSLARAGGRAFLPLAHGPGRAYHLKGYGAVVVLSPRPLAPRRVVRHVVPGDIGAREDVARALAEAQRELAQNMALLQQQGMPQVEIPMIALGDLEREMEQQMAAQAAAMRQFDLDQQEWTRQREEALRGEIRM